MLVTNHVVSNLREMVTLLETFANSERQLLIIAEDIKGEAREALVMNKERGSLKVAAMKGPGFGGTSFPPSLLPSLLVSVVDTKGEEERGETLPVKVAPLQAFRDLKKDVLTNNQLPGQLINVSGKSTR